MNQTKHKTLFVALLVGVAHTVSGIAVLVSPAALNVTPMASLQYLDQILGYSNGLAGGILLFAGIMAIIASSFSAIPRKFYGYMYLPQQVLLVLQIYTICEALIRCKYPDGYIPQGGCWFILTDQIWAWVLAISHSVWLAVFIYKSEDSGRGS